MHTISIKAKESGTLHRQKLLDKKKHTFYKSALARLLIALGALVSINCSSCLAHVADENSQKTTITVNQFVNHIALDSAYDGLKQSLSDQGYFPDKVKLIYGNAQGNISNSVMISKHHASLNPDIMVAIATPSMQTNLKAKVGIEKDVVTAFLAVTDLSSLNIDNQQNLIGVTDNPPIDELFILATKIFTDLKMVGIVYNAGEINSVKIVSDLERTAANYGFMIKLATINSSNDIKGAIAKLSEVDLIYLPQDNTVISALDNVVTLTKKAEIPLIANDPTLVERGVMLALGTNYYNSGQQLGNMIIDLIEGKEIKPAIQSSNVNELRINQEIIKMFNIQIPNNIMQDKRLVP